MIKIKASHKYLLSVFLVSLIIFVPALFAVFKNNQKSKSVLSPPAQEITKEPLPAPAEKSTASERHIGAWVTYMDLNISDSENTESSFKSRFENVIEKSKKFHVNDLYVHVRPFCDSLYPSKIFPWSHLLTGTQGKDPAFDPLKYMIEISHKNGIKFHAWVNPLRVKLKNMPTELSSENPYYKLGSFKYFLESEGTICLNPGYEETQNLVLEGIKEIVSNYEVDGIHFDDYFYPESTEIKDCAAEENQVSDIIAWRKKCITKLIEGAHSAVKSANKNIAFGISPLGNNEKCNAMGIDAQELCKTKAIDYICPQLYWSLKYKVMPFEKAAKIWQEMTKNTGVKLFGGLALYKIGTELDDKTWQDDKNILPKEIEILENLGYDGAILYSFGQLDELKEEISNLLKKLS